MNWLNEVAVGVSRGIRQNPRTRSADKVMIHGKQLESAVASRRITIKVTSEGLDW
ncbi:hypothetical protein FVEG_05356 [Fusarium verticillioides 7600]|uniref:Uncharacterized protein n=1 Tax=Gibberella moniliformis (strain M3125 / FGSC 7600) TaxID=334819 RepID=W7LZX0_GIBM7|nr:hypothetical protein FVEG_05356 [Fusarium verticillioides 7600]EWG44221.1 hypothetical protein FVEG_05356 [Fusarium verticillioides 7600]